MHRRANSSRRRGNTDRTKWSRSACMSKKVEEMKQRKESIEAYKQAVYPNPELLATLSTSTPHADESRRSAMKLA